MIRPYLKDLINDHIPVMGLDNEKYNSDTERGEWKVQLVMQNNCIFTKDSEETRTMYSASKPVEIFMGTDTDGAIDKLFDTLLQRFQQAIETSNERGSRFTINPRNKNDNKCFQYAIAIALNYNEIKKYIFERNRKI